MRKNILAFLNVSMPFLANWDRMGQQPVSHWFSNPVKGKELEVKLPFGTCTIKLFTVVIHGFS
jgi:hypothetical protein